MYYNWKNTIDTKELANVKKLINNGEIIVFPTETVYGIGANALDSEAVKKIFFAKGRPSDNPLIVHVANKQTIGELAEVQSAVEQLLIDAFMPGPITIILKKKKIIPDIVSAGLETVGIRMPSNKIANKIIETSEVPIAAPSANISGRPSGTHIDDIRSELEEKVAVVIDGGESDIGLESTVVKVINDIPTILRPGKITPEQIEEVIGKVCIDKNVFGKINIEEKVESPGMKYRHYAPKTRCKLIYAKDENKQIEIINNLIQNNNNIIVLGFEEHKNKINVQDDKFISIGYKSDTQTIARSIYSILRKTDEKNAELILIEGIEKKRTWYCNYE